MDAEPERHTDVTLSDAAAGEFSRLLAERRRMRERGRDRAETLLADIRAERAESHDDDEHDPEGSTMSAEWSRAEGAREDTARELRDIIAAQERIRTGVFGICEGCGRRIPRERLRVRPEATHCVACASSLAPR